MQPNHRTHRTEKIGPLTACLKYCWVEASNWRISCVDRSFFGPRPHLAALVVESIRVEEAYQRQGHCRRYLESLCRIPGYDLVILQGLTRRTPAGLGLGEWLLAHGWTADPKVRDFYWRHPSNPSVHA